MPLRLAVFDFDQTLTTVHLYNALAGDESSWRLPSPHAKTESGQLLRLQELEAAPEFRQQGGLALAAFGGSERVARLRGMLQQFVGSGVECIICSRGLVGPVRKCLDQLGLLGFFTKVYANIGCAYGSTPYDRHMPPNALGTDTKYLGSSDLADWNNNKQALVSRCIRERGLRGQDAVFVDDHPSEIESVRAICPTVQVQSQRGIGSREIELLRNLLGGGFGGAQPPGSAAGLADASRSRGQSTSPVSHERPGTGSLEAVSLPGTGHSFNQQQVMRGPPPPPPPPAAVVPGSGCLQHTARQSSQHTPGHLPHSLSSLPAQQGAAASFLLPVPPLSLPCHSAPGTPQTRPGYKLSGGHQAGSQYPQSQSFVRTVPTLESLSLPPRHQHHRAPGAGYAALESGSFSDSEPGGTTSVANAQRRKNPWCCSQ